MSSAEPVVEPVVEEVVEPVVDQVVDQVVDPLLDSDDDDDDALTPAERHAKAITKRNNENKSLRVRLRTAEAALAAAQVKADRLDELTEKEKSELTKLTERAERAEQKLVEKEAADTQRVFEAERKTIQEEFGFTDAQMKRVKGDNVDDLREDAEEYAEANGIVKPDPKAKPARQIKPEDVKGRRGDDDNDNSTPAELAMLISRR